MSNSFFARHSSRLNVFASTPRKVYGKYLPRKSNAANQRPILSAFLQARDMTENVTKPLGLNDQSLAS
ncbi:hypothetical protein [Thalassoroseus pseudoceratinae]|uniref:hypothetical protein n=1 Tax=Thalassoroseus pseudoceratinae TaxID=2713176 RepID=UPI00142488FA|nr:hypothetical protein [Thalassoroseus pseudoceratinae]